MVKVVDISKLLIVSLIKYLLPICLCLQVVPLKHLVYGGFKAYRVCFGGVSSVINLKPTAFGPGALERVNI